MNRSRSRARHNYTNHKKCPGKMSFCSKQHLSNTWRSNHGEVKQHWGLAGKKRVYLPIQLQIVSYQTTSEDFLTSQNVF